MPELDDSVFVSAGACASAGGCVSAGAAGTDDEEEVPELEEPELPQPATPSATRTTLSAIHRRGLAPAYWSDDFVSMSPPWWCGRDRAPCKLDRTAERFRSGMARQAVRRRHPRNLPPSHDI